LSEAVAFSLPCRGGLVEELWVHSGKTEGESNKSWVRAGVILAGCNGGHARPLQRGKDDAA